MKILCVDDDKAVLGALANALVHEGYEPVCASDYAGAITEFEKIGDELVGALLDIRLAGESGITVAKKIRETSDLPLIAVSAYLDNATIGQCKEAGFNACLNKPFDIRQLFEATHEMFDGYAKDKNIK